MKTRSPFFCRQLTALLFASLASLHAAAQPNIVLMYADNLGYGDLGCYGNKDIQTPRLDRLAKEGVRCTDFYVTTATYTPSRGAILTGRHPRRNGLAHQLATAENWTGIGLPHRERIIPQYLKAAGYATACFGKWNIGFAPGSRPTERGFDEFLGCRSGTTKTKPTCMLVGWGAAGSEKREGERIFRASAAASPSHPDRRCSWHSAGRS